MNEKLALKKCTAIGNRKSKVFLRKEVVIVLKRDEATSVVKELFDKCSYLDGKFVSVVAPTSIEPTPPGYQIHIKANLDSLIEACIRETLANHDLTMQAFKNEDLVIISKKVIPSHVP